MSAVQQLLAAGGFVPAVPGQQEYTAAGTYSWVCPVGVTSVSVVCVGAGGSWALDTASPPKELYSAGGGGALAYANNIAVTPGNSYAVIVGAGISDMPGGNSSFNTTNVKAGGGAIGNFTTGGAGGTVLNGVGGSGGSGGVASGSSQHASGGGGAGGYSGAGGNGSMTTGTSGAGGAGGGGSGFYGGGGVGVMGAGSNGAGGTSGGGGGGSGGQTPLGGVGGLYGGGSQGGGSQGAVRIIWPGNLRQFPSTRTANE